MKSQKGVTLTSLAIYLVLATIVLATLAVITANFQGNIKGLNKEGTKNTEIDKLNIYLLQEAKKQNNSVKSISEGNDEISFTMGNTYSFKENSVYLNNDMEISKDIETCEFGRKIENGKEIVILTIKAKDVDARTIEYTLSNQGI